MSRFDIPRPRKGSIKIHRNIFLLKSGPPESRTAAPAGTGSGGTSKITKAKKLIKAYIKLGSASSNNNSNRSAVAVASQRLPKASAHSRLRFGYEASNFDARATALANELHQRNAIVTEENLANYFASIISNYLRYCHDTGAWYVFDGFRWHLDRMRFAFEKVRFFVRSLTNFKPGKVRHASGRISFIRGVETYAKSDPRLAVDASFWDRHPFLLGTPGGTVDLRTGVLRQSNPREGISKSTAVAPAKCAGAPRWMAFLNEATGDDFELIQFVQRFCGYALSGYTREHALVFIYGPGGNGKTVFNNVVTNILGDYATTAAIDTFTATSGDRHTTDLAMLRGARLVSASETEQGKAWAESRIKQLTGGDPITARFMRQDNFTYKPTFKMLIVGNHKPQIRSVDDALRRRVNIIPFTRTPVNPDRQLEAKLMEEAPAILRWMIDGYLDWQKNGLQPPKTVRDATETYFVEQDLFGQWLNEVCDVDQGNARKRERTSDLYQSWRTYAERAGEKPGAKKTFSENMSRRGFTSYRTATERGFGGISLDRRTPMRILPPPRAVTGPL